MGPAPVPPRISGLSGSALPFIPVGIMQFRIMLFSSRSDPSVQEKFRELWLAAKTKSEY